MIAPPYADHVRAGTYNAGTGVWTNGATYNIARDGDNFKVTGVIPYGAADSVFPTAGHRFAVRVSQDGITSADQLPSGTIVKTTNTEAQSGYNTSTKDAFETDGSLIAIFAPTAESKDAYLREVKIKWKTGGQFKTYTFDLSEATLSNS